MRYSLCHSLSKLTSVFFGRNHRYSGAAYDVGDDVVQKCIGLALTFIFVVDNDIEIVVLKKKLKYCRVMFSMFGKKPINLFAMYKWEFKLF